MKVCSAGRGDLSRQVSLVKAGGRAITTTLSKAVKLAKKRTCVSADFVKLFNIHFQA